MSANDLTLRLGEGNVVEPLLEGEVDRDRENLSDAGWDQALHSEEEHSLLRRRIKDESFESDGESRSYSYRAS